MGAATHALEGASQKRHYNRHSLRHGPQGRGYSDSALDVSANGALFHSETSLPPGSFSAILASKNGGSGGGLIEIYNVQ